MSRKITLEIEEAFREWAKTLDWQDSRNIEWAVHHPEWWYMVWKDFWKHYDSKQKPWWESSDNVLALARWMIRQGEISNATDCVIAPELHEYAWESYQASLQPEKEEPKLSERINKVLNGGDYNVTQTLCFVREITCRLEALEEKLILIKKEN